MKNEIDNRNGSAKNDRQSIVGDNRFITNWDYSQVCTTSNERVRAVQRGWSEAQTFFRTWKIIYILTLESRKDPQHTSLDRAEPTASQINTSEDAFPLIDRKKPTNSIVHEHNIFW
jgi:hypothetical protein